MTPLRLVLDTNVVIDWLVFDHPFMNPLRDAVTAGRVEVLRCAATAAEFQRVLGYPSLKLEAARQAALWARFLSQTGEPRLPPGFAREQLLTPGAFPPCKDRDDEVFLALAFHARADALASRDNAVLGLKKRVATYGIDVLDVRALIERLARFHPIRPAAWPA
jgi:predicted nucleic acid-binding protein